MIKTFLDNRNLIRPVFTPEMWKEPQHALLNINEVFGKAKSEFNIVPQANSWNGLHDIAPLLNLFQWL